MVWDFAESAVWGDATGSAELCLDWVCKGIEETLTGPGCAHVERGSATSLAFPDGGFDAVITDPPYYDNIGYADISDFFYVWLKRSIGHLYPEHFATASTPKKDEAVAAVHRHGGSKEKARQAYEGMMARAFAEAYRVLKAHGQMTVVYAHKTTLGWATLVDSLRHAGFVVTEAWPLDTEMKSKVGSADKAMLASSIFLVARKREGAVAGNYEQEVRPELEEIVRERVQTLWDMEVSGADLVIACVGAGLRAFTRFASVEYANGEPVPAERFLAEVETVVLETILDRLSKEVVQASGLPEQSRKPEACTTGGATVPVASAEPPTGREPEARATRSKPEACTTLAGVDPATRFYILWRYTYHTADLDAGEAIIFANGTHVELDGQGSLSQGARPLIEKKKGRYRLLDYAERGRDEKLGLPAENGQPAPLVDALHRTLWLMENGPSQLEGFLRDAQPDLEQMRLVAQALAGPALKGGELPDLSPAAEVGALGILFRNWQSVVGGAMPLFRPGKGKPE
jgi:putative DNA methylase